MDQPSIDAVEIHGPTLQFSDHRWEDLFLWQAHMFVLKKVDVMSLVMTICLTCTRLLINSSDCDLWFYSTCVVVTSLCHSLILLYIQSAQAIRLRSLVVACARIGLIAISATQCGVVTRPSFQPNIWNLVCWAILPNIWTQLGMPIVFKHNLIVAPIEFAVYSWLANNRICSAIMHIDNISSSLHAVWNVTDTWANLATVQIHPHSAFMSPLEIQDLALMCRLLLIFWQLFAAMFLPLVIMYHVERSARLHFARQPGLPGVLVHDVFSHVHSPLTKFLTFCHYTVLSFLAAWQLLLTAATVMNTPHPSQ